MYQRDVFSSVTFRGEIATPDGRSMYCSTSMWRVGRERERERERERKRGEREREREREREGGVGGGS